jgi:hypothetical protein
MFGLQQQGRGSPVVGHSWKHWAFLCLREAGLLAATEWHSVEELRFHSLMGKWGVSIGRAWWLVLGLCTVWGWKPPGASRIAKCGVRSSLACIKVDSCHVVTSLGCQWGSKAGRLESSGAHNAAEALGSTYIGV